jgi:hypothetical protein
LKGINKGATRVPDGIDQMEATREEELRSSKGTDMSAASKKACGLTLLNNNKETQTGEGEQAGEVAGAKHRHKLPEGCRPESKSTSRQSTTPVRAKTLA